MQVGEEFMKKLIIKKGFYYSCGRNYGWKADGFSEIGVGIAKPWLKDNKAIIVNVDKQDYHLDCEQAIAFINKYKCFEDWSGVRLGYVSKDLFRKLDDKIE